MSGFPTSVFAKNMRSWANIANENSQKKRATRRARGEPSRSPRSPVTGNTRGNGNSMEIYAKKRWVKAHDPMGDYGGPYANIKNLQKNTRYVRNQLEAIGDKFKYNVAKLEQNLKGSPGLKRAAARQKLRKMGKLPKAATKKKSRWGNAKE
jgi:hypothetical protein